MCSRERSLQGLRRNNRTYENRAPFWGAVFSDMTGIKKNNSVKACGAANNIPYAFLHHIPNESEKEETVKKIRRVCRWKK